MIKSGSVQLILSSKLRLRFAFFAVICYEEDTGDVRLMILVNAPVFFSAHGVYVPLPISLKSVHTIKCTTSNTPQTGGLPQSAI